MVVKTSKRTHVWVVQKKQGKRWTNIVDNAGVITFQTREFARYVAREYKNISRTPRNYRVKKLA